MVCSVNLCTVRVKLDFEEMGLILSVWSQKSLLRKTDIEASDGPPPDHAKKPAVKKGINILLKHSCTNVK